MTATKKLHLDGPAMKGIRALLHRTVDQAMNALAAGHIVIFMRKMRELGSIVANMETVDQAAWMCRCWHHEVDLDKFPEALTITAMSEVVCTAAKPGPDGELPEGAFPVA